MNTVRYRIVEYHRESRFPSGNLVTAEELARLAHLHPEIVVRLWQWGLVEPETSEPEPLFPDTLVPTIRKIIRLRQDLGINLAGIGVVLELLDRIDRLEQEIARLREQRP